MWPLAGLYWARVPAQAAIVVGVSMTFVIHLKTNGTGFGILSPVALGVILAASALVAFTYLGKPGWQRL